MEWKVIKFAKRRVIVMKKRMQERMQYISSPCKHNSNSGVLFEWMIRSTELENSKITSKLENKLIFQ